MRAVQIKMVKENAPGYIAPENDTFEEHTAVVSAAVNRTVKSITMAVFGYVLLDTVRRVIVEATSHK